MHGVGLDNDFLAMAPKAHVTKRKKQSGLNFIRIENFCASKDAIDRMESQPMEMGENICT